MRITDLHNHTKFSYDGTNTCEEIIENGIKKGISVIGISDHQFSINNLDEYIEKVKECKEKYKDKITVKCGLEIGLRPKPSDLVSFNRKGLDYCLFESLDSNRDYTMDLYEFLEWTRLFKMPKGLAHTDIFRLSEKYHTDILKLMKEYDLFWEINTSGNYTYYYDFITNFSKQQIIKKSGIAVSIGSDTHYVNDLKTEKLRSAHNLVSSLGNPIIFL